MVLTGEILDFDRLPDVYQPRRFDVIREIAFQLRWNRLEFSLNPTVIALSKCK